MKSWDYGRVALTYTLQCNARCSFCAVNAGPEVNYRMDLKTAFHCIRQISQHRFFKEIKITGGEPFLFFDDLIKMLEEIKRLGLKASIITNGFWAETEETAFNILETLIKKGLDEINYSADSFHEKFIPTERLNHAFKATRSLGLPLIIYYVQGADSGSFPIFLEKCHLSPENILVLGADETFKIPEYGRCSNDTRKVIIRKTFVSPAGRGKNLSEELVLFPVETFPETGCVEIGRSYVVMPNLDVFACCSGYLPDSLKVGNLRKGRWKRIAERIHEDMIMQVLANRGVIFLFKKLVRAGLISASPAYAGMCHLCDEILSSIPRNKLEDFLCEAFFET